LPSVGFQVVFDGHSQAPATPPTHSCPVGQHMLLEQLMPAAQEPQLTGGPAAAAPRGDSRAAARPRHLLGDAGEAADENPPIAQGTGSVTSPVQA